MKKQFKLLISVLFFLTTVFNFSYSQFGDDFELSCPTCDTGTVVAPPSLVDCGDGFTAPTRADCPVYNEPTQVGCGYDQHYSQWAGKCMKYCPNLSGEYDISYSCPIQVDCGNGVFVTVPMSCPNTQQDNTTQPVTNQTTQTSPVNTAPNTGGVTVTYRPAQIYNPIPVYTQTVGTTYSPTNWGTNVGTSQTYNSAPIYAPPVVTIPSAPRIVCPINYTVNGQECAPNKKQCFDGSQVNFYELCTKTCWSGTLAGQKIPENQSCPAGTVSQSNPAQTYNPQIIYTNPVRPVNNTAYVATNWGGSSSGAQTYTTSQTYATRTNVSVTKVCKDGNTVYDYQICTRVCTDGKVINENYVCPAIQANHQVVTTSPTQIANSSARCNAVADVVNRVNTTGYFEYGDTPSLGKSTNSGNIGYGDNIYYANSIINLEPGTKYYCRAVIVNKDGVYKGDIVSFVTNKNKKVYASTLIEEVYKKEAVSTPVKKGVVKKVEQKKVEVTCKDVEGNTDKLESGEKFLDMRLENISGYISRGEISDYRLEYKNRSNLNLENVVIKVNVPEGMTFVSASEGTESNDEIILEINTLKANESKVINIKLKGESNLVVGKNIIVQANSAYEMLDENGEQISDESSVYSISTVTDKIVNINSKTSKETETFWSGWLFKFLLSILLLVILFILGRNIYKKIIHKRHADRILGHH